MGWSTGLPIITLLALQSADSLSQDPLVTAPTETYATQTSEIPEFNVDKVPVLRTFKVIRPVDSAASCQALCQAESKCSAFQWKSIKRTACELKNIQMKTRKNFVSGEISSTGCTTTTISPLSDVLLLVGGIGSNGYLSSGEVFGSSCSVPDLPSATYGHIVEYYDDKILACGGWTSGSYTPLCYSLQTSGWVEHSNMGASRYEASAVITNSNVLYVLGGDGSSGSTHSSEYFTPGSNNWLAGPVIPGDGVARSCAVGLGNGFLVIGGQYGSRTQVLEYDGSTWTNWPDLTVGRYGHSCVEYGSQIIVAGGIVSGSDYLATTVIINTLTQTNTDGPDMAVARAWFVFNKVNGQMLAVGGFNNNGVRLASGETFDVSSGGELLSMVITVGRSGHGAAVVPKSVLASMFGCA